MINFPDIQINFNNFIVDEKSTVTVSVSTSLADPNRRISRIDSICRLYTFQIKSNEISRKVNEEGLLKDWQGRVEHFYGLHFSEMMTLDQFKDNFSYNLQPLSSDTGDYLATAVFDTIETSDTIDYICYYSNLYIDYEQYCSSIGIPTGPRIKKLMMCLDRPSKKILFTDGRIKLNSTFLRVPGETQPWSGGYHTMRMSLGEPLVFMTGSEHSDDSVQLELVTTPDNRILDRRRLGKIKTLDPLLSSFKLEKLKFFKDQLRLGNKRPINYWTEYKDYKIRYFDGIYLSPTRDGKYNFNFTFNMGSENNDGFVQDMGSFPSHFRAGKPTANLLSRYFKLNNVRILRRRVMEKSPNIRFQHEPRTTVMLSSGLDADAELGFKIYDNGAVAGKGKELTPYDRDNPTEELVIDLMAGQTVSNYRPSGSLETNSLRIMDGSVSGMIQVTGTDSTIKDKTYGRYQYAVEIDIIDESPRYIKECYDNLVTHQNELVDYRRMLTLKKSIWNRERGRVNLDALDGDPIGTRLRELESKIKDNVIYLYDLYRATTDKELLEQQAATILLLMVSLEYTKPSILFDLEKLYKTFIQVFYEALSYKNSLRRDRDYNSFKAKKRYIRIKKYFTNDVVMAGNSRNNVFMEFVSYEDMAVPGSPIISEADLSTRIADQMSIYEDVISTTEADGAYLTPERIAIENGPVVELMSSEVDSEQINNIINFSNDRIGVSSIPYSSAMASIENNDQFLNSDFVATIRSVDNSASRLASVSDTVIRPLRVSDQRNPSLPDKERNNFIRVQEFDLNEDNFDILERDSRVNRGVNNFNSMLYDRDNQNDIVVPADLVSKLSNVDNFIPSLAPDRIGSIQTIDRIMMHNIEDQPASIRFLAASPQVIQMSSNFFEVYYRYFCNASVKMLVGYEEVAGRPCLNKPIWSPLDLNLVRSSRKEFLCKMERFEDELIDPTLARKLNLNIYNEYFILKMDMNINTRVGNRNTFEDSSRTGRREQVREREERRAMVAPEFMIEPDMEISYEPIRMERMQPQTRTPIRSPRPRRTSGGGSSRY